MIGLRRILVPPPGATTAFPSTPVDSPPRPTSRCKMQLIHGTSDHLTTEMTVLLRRRLRVASMIALAPSLYFLLERIFGSINLSSQYGRFDIPIQAAVVFLLAAICGMLWSRTPLSSCSLRRIELLLFGSMTAFFTWLQLCMLGCPHFLEWIPVGSRGERNLVELVLLSSTLRWFFLIVLYGVFIPNTARRCAIPVGLTIAIVLALTAFMGSHNERIRPYLGDVLSVMAMVLLVAGAIALFGSYRIHGLQEQANQARKLGQYHLRRKLGSGGMGEVWLGEHSLLRRPCAIKLIHPEQASDPNTLSRFEREVRAMANLTHWNTVEVYDYGHTVDGTFYYVMQYLPGQNLENLVQGNGPLPYGRVVHLLRQVCAALREAHSANLLHRDIKPSNIIVCERGGVHDVVKLLDFGLVQELGLNRQADKLTVQGTILGSPPFLSPEQARGRPDLTSASDLYSVGGVAYFLLTGQPPFVRQTIMELLIAHATETVIPLSEYRPDIPADLEAIVMRCLEKNPAMRFADAASLDQALASCACASEWTEDMARVWWEEHGTTETVEPRQGTTDEILVSTSVAT